MSVTVLGALTTIFTPPASCSDVITFAGPASPSPPTASEGSAWKGGYGSKGDSACFPSGFPDISLQDRTYYSPGFCPHGWTSMTFSGETYASTVGLETTAMCCPRCVFVRAVLQRERAILVRGNTS